MSSTTLSPSSLRVSTTLAIAPWAPSFGVIAFASGSRHTPYHPTIWAIYVTPCLTVHRPPPFFPQTSPPAPMNGMTSSSMPSFRPSRRETLSSRPCSLSAAGEAAGGSGVLAPHWCVWAGGQVGEWGRRASGRLGAAGSPCCHGSGFLRQWLPAKKQKTCETPYRTMNEIGSGFENLFSQACATKANRTKFIKSSMAFAKRYGFDG